jgi:hypothetical protein
MTYHFAVLTRIPKNDKLPLPELEYSIVIELFMVMLCSPANGGQVVRLLQLSILLILEKNPEK